ncbi:MAG: Uma2 family endonuclease [Roseofilum sp. SBFL]|uniref:Uma2 family endonuclease n=1 Tax=unclassified Roseofilum TaxID=2620099 RepID=UPI001B1F4820|nr:MULTISPECIES: Uma2 family endonuclease [unclassified Roseofilum]MBP0015200.1 Uma2 family endonuclease [Roseofilum sp. SID3]MBP0024476.1 Uma2 family endonuclease [Roseofilum sp. SID2]MBP0038753.1 Uma2 family endonuclease [Roseofilum sp. SID1]MBP0044612.1 Uma2 family endonuclease [Roseofilum sp. SBFL]
MTSTLAQSQSHIPLPSIPPLANGDRLTRVEFERRYFNMPKLKKAELIEGVVYMASPLRFTPHAEPHGDLMGWLWTYKISRPDLQMGIEPTVRLDMDNELQPDGVLLIRPECGGQATLSKDGYLEGPPELVVEVAASSAAIDLGNKKRAYRRNGIQEYIVWQVFDRRIDWFRLEDGDYVNLEPDETGVICSRSFPGLWLDVGAMIEGHMVQVLTVLQSGINALDRP